MSPKRNLRFFCSFEGLGKKINIYFSFLSRFYSVSHLRNSFFKGPKMSENQYVDKEKRQQHNQKASPFDLQPLEWILNTEAGLHSLQYLVVIVLRSQKMHNIKLHF